MRSSKKLVSIRYKDGKVKRLPRTKADLLVEQGQAQFISKTHFKAAESGVKVKPGQSDSKIMAAIKAIKEKKQKKKID